MLGPGKTANSDVEFASGKLPGRLRAVAAGEGAILYPIAVLARLGNRSAGNVKLRFVNQDSPIDDLSDTAGQIEEHFITEQFTIGIAEMHIAKGFGLAGIVLKAHPIGAKFLLPLAQHNLALRKIGAGDLIKGHLLRFKLYRLLRATPFGFGPESQLHRANQQTACQCKMPPYYFLLHR